MTKLFDPGSKVGGEYVDYMVARARLWHEKYIDGRRQDYRDDAILQKYHFCNVWRELDRYSQWEIRRMRGRTLDEQLDVIVIGRMSMVPAMAELLMSGVDAKAVNAFREGRQAAGLPWYNPALQITTKLGMSYADHFVWHRDSYLSQKDGILTAVRDAGHTRDIFEILMGIYGVGPFKAYEIVTSLTYSEHLPKLDEDQTFNVGPGAIAGLQLLTGGGEYSREVFENLRDEVAAHLATVPAFKWIPLRWQGSQNNRRRHKFTLRTLEDSLCEFRKYVALTQPGVATAKRRGYHVKDITV